MDNLSIVAWIDGARKSVWPARSKEVEPGALGLVLASDLVRVTAERDAALGREAALREDLKVSMLGHKNTTDAGARAMAERDELQVRLNESDELSDQ